MFVCLTKTGKLIEMQHPGRAGMLIDNAIRAGYKKEDIVEKEVTEKEWLDILEAQPKPTPAIDVIAALQSKVDKISNSLVSKGVLVNADVTVTTPKQKKS